MQIPNLIEYIASGKLDGVFAMLYPDPIAARTRYIQNLIAFQGAFGLSLIHIFPACLPRTLYIWDSIAWIFSLFQLLRISTSRPCAVRSRKKLRWISVSVIMEVKLIASLSP